MGLSFEQYLQLGQEKAKMEEGLNLGLRAEVAMEMERLKIEELKLELKKEGKAQESLIAMGRESESTGGDTGFDVAGSLRLMPRFDEKDPDIFFALFEHVAGVRGWPDTQKTLQLQCIFTGKAQRVFSALSSAESGD